MHRFLTNCNRRNYTESVRAALCGSVLLAAIFGSRSMIAVGYGETKQWIVDTDGTGDFRTIQEVVLSPFRARALPCAMEER